MAVFGEGFVQPGAGKRRGGQVLIDSAQLPLQQVEAQAARHGSVALMAYPGAGGDGFARGQRQVIQGQLQGGLLAR